MFKETGLFMLFSYPVVNYSYIPGSFPTWMDGYQLYSTSNLSTNATLLLRGYLDYSITLHCCFMLFCWPVAGWRIYMWPKK